MIIGFYIYMEQIKGPAHPELKPSTFFEIVSVPTVQAIYAEFENVVVRHRKGDLVTIESPAHPDDPLWKKFIPERSLNDDFKIPFYERRNKRAQKKAAKFAAALAYKKVGI
jgi:hypothetical protein